MSLTQPETTYQRGDRVRILNCPTGRHHGWVGEVLESHKTIVCVELDDGCRCWPEVVETACSEVEPSS